MSSEEEKTHGIPLPRTPESNTTQNHDEAPKTPTKQTGKAAITLSPCPHNTPIIRNENSCKEGFLQPNASARYKRFSEEFKGWYIGPMPVQEFMDAFMPSSTIGGKQEMPPSHGAFLLVPDEEEIKDEKDIYLPFVSGLFVMRTLVVHNIISVQSIQ